MLLKDTGLGGGTLICDATVALSADVDVYLSLALTCSLRHTAAVPGSHRGRLDASATLT